MSIRSTFGMTGFDLAVHLLVTLFALLIVGRGVAPEVAFLTVPVASILILTWRRGRGLRKDQAGPTGEAAAAHIYELEGRVAELEALQDRLFELEERVDFAERLLARDTEAQRLGKGS